MRFGFDPDLGAENYAPDNIEGNYLGAQAQEKAISDETRKLIDDKVRELLSNAYAQAKSIITKNKKLHEELADLLLQKEELLQEEFDEYFKDLTVAPEKITM
jgi:cell division protease FtsH